MRRPLPLPALGNVKVPVTAPTVNEKPSAQRRQTPAPLYQFREIPAKMRRTVKVRIGQYTVKRPDA